MEFEQYVVARRTALVRSAVLLGAAQHEAEDLVQAALTRCLRSWRRIAQAHNPDAYVYRVLTNVMRDAASRRWNGEVPTEVMPDSAVHDPDAVAGLHVRRVLAALPLEQRQVLVLRYYADLSEREIASALGVSAGTVKSRASRGLARLAVDHDLRSSDV